MPTRSSSLQNNTVNGISRDIGSQYDVVKSVADNIDIIANISTTDLAAIDSTIKAVEYIAGIDQELGTTADVVHNSVEAGLLRVSGGTGTQGEFSWNVDEETVDLVQNGAVLQLGQELQWHCRNNTSSTIANGTVVMATGTLGASGRITIAPMDLSSKSNAKYILGVTTEDIIAGDDGKVTHIGKVRGIDTSMYTDGTLLYVSNSVPGAFTNVEPSVGSVNLPIAMVISAANNGTIAVRTESYDRNQGKSTVSGTYVMADVASITVVDGIITSIVGG